MSKGLLSGVLLLIAVACAVPQAKAACATSGAQCLPESSVTSAGRVTDTYHLDFSTTNQNMWTAGAGVSGKSDSLVLLDRSQATFGNTSGYSAGGITTYCLYDELDSLLSGVDLLGNALSYIIGLFKDNFSNPCYSYGASISATFNGSAGLSMNLQSDRGSVAVQYPIALSFSAPAADKFMPGDTIEISASSTVRPGVSLSTTSPDGTVALDGGADMHLGSTASGCIDSCTNVTLLPSYNFDVSQNSSIVGAAGLNYQLSTFNPLDMLTNPPSSLLNFLAGSAGTVGIPKLDASTNALDANGRTLSASGSDLFTDLAIDLDLWLSRLAGNLGSVTSRSLSFNNVTLQSSAIDSTVNVQARYHQSFSFDPRFYIEITFPTAVTWSVIDTGGATLRSGSGPIITIQPGETLRVDSSPFTEPATVSARIYQQNDFHNTTSVSTDSALDMYALKYQAITPSWTIFNSRCILADTICTPKLTWPGSNISYGPYYNATDIGHRQIDYPVTDTGWQLQGFQQFPLQTLQLDPNQVPTGPTKMSPQALVVGKTRVLDLAKYFSDPDGNPLTFTLDILASDAPPLDIAQDGNKMQLTALSVFAPVPARITASDGNGGTASVRVMLIAPPPPIPTLPLPAYLLLCLLLVALMLLLRQKRAIPT